MLCRNGLLTRHSRLRMTRTILVAALKRESLIPSTSPISSLARVLDAVPMTRRLHRLSVLWKNWMFNQEPEQDQIQDQISEPAASQSCDQSEQLTLSSEQGQSSSGGGSALPTQSSSAEAQLGHVFQVDNASEVEERALQREASQRRSRRRFRKVNPRGERELITDGQEPTVRTNANV